jgi:hypothetical protein
MYKFSYLNSLDWGHASGVRSLALAPMNRGPKYIGVLTIVISELELIDVQRKIFATDFMECTDNAALYNAPESFNGIGMNVPMHIFAFTVMYEIQ